MRHRTLRCAAALTLLSIVAAATAHAADPAPAADDVFQVGVAKVDVTPDYPIRLSGFGSRRDESEGVRQHIFAKALAIGRGDEPPLVLVTLDNLGIRLSIVEEVASRLAKKFGIPRDHFALTFTHTHSAPKTNGSADTIFSTPMPPEHQAHVDRYTRELTDWIEQVAAAAIADRKPARLKWGVGAVGFAVNRRTPGGPVDHDLPLLVVEDLDGKIRALYFSYACHCVTLSDNLISGDWAGYAEDLIEHSHPGAVALASVGCGSDSNPQSGVTGDKADVAAGQGREVADEVDRLLGAPLKPLHGNLEATLKHIDLPLAKLPTRAKFEALKKQGGPAGYAAEFQLAKLDRGEALVDAIDYPIQTFSVGDDLSIVFLAGEICVDYSLRLKHDLDRSRVWLNGYSNDFCCYIPSERLLREGGYGGGDEIVYFGLPTRLAPGMEEKIITEAKRQVPARFHANAHTQGVAPLSPAESLAAMKTHDDLVVELVAAEPLVLDPVAIDFAPDGALWVAEMADYTRKVDAEFPHQGSVRRLVDRDGDGKFDAATTFCDGLRFPTDVKSWRDGVLVCDAPDVLYFPDVDHDGRADSRETVLTGFATHNPQARVNSLRWGLDNWLYGSGGLFSGVITTKTGRVVDLGTSDFRFRPDTGEIETATGTTQQGRSRNDWNDWFGCENGTLLFHYPLDGHYLSRNPSLAPPRLAVEPNDYPNARQLYPAGQLVTFKLSGPPGQPTSSCGMDLYRDRLLGDDFYGNTFTCEPVNQLVHRLVLTPRSTSFSARRHPSEQASEILTSSDRWFRPVQVRTGRDGALWIVDMYRYVIEHPQWIPEETLRDLDPMAGADRGRIYRLRPRNKDLRKVQDLTRLHVAALVAALDTNNGPTRDLVHELLVHRGETTAVEPLQQLAKSAKSPAVRVQALCTLDGMGKLTPPLVVGALADSHPGVRRHAVRLAEPFFQSSPELVKQAAALADDADAFVRQQAAYSLGSATGPVAAPALATLARKSADDPYMLAAVLSSVTPANAASMVEAVLGPQSPAECPVDFLTQLLRSSVRLGGADAAARELAIVAALPADRQSQRIDAARAILESLEGRRGDLFAKADDATVRLLGQFSAEAQEIAEDLDANPERRAAAVHLLVLTTTDLQEAVDKLEPTLNASNPPEVQAAVITAWAATGAPAAADALLEAWPQLTGSVRILALDAMLSRDEWAQRLLKRIGAGEIKPTDLDAARRQQLMTHSNPELKARAVEVLAAVADPLRADVVKRYATALQLAGDSARGHVLFTKHCSTCHQFNGEGHVVGPDLASTAARTAQSLVDSILDPSREIDDRYRAYVAVSGGLARTGIIKGETTASITFIGQDGVAATLLRSELDELRASPASLMPEGLEKELSEQAVADLIKYLTAAPGERGSPASGESLEGVR